MRGSLDELGRRRTTHANAANTVLDFESNGKQLPCFGRFGHTLAILGKFDRLIDWHSQMSRGCPRLSKKLVHPYTGLAPVARLMRVPRGCADVSSKQLPFSSLVRLKINLFSLRALFLELALAPWRKCLGEGREWPEWFGTVLYRRARVYILVGAHKGIFESNHMMT